jgi:hypothetical protein
MQLLVPEILEEGRQLSPFVSGTGLVVGLLLWSLGARTHRFWLALSVTAGAGLLGLLYGGDFDMQPLVAGLLLAVSAGVLALSLVRLLVFLAGGLAALGLLQAIAPSWDERVACFVVGGLVGVLLYRFWITVLASLVGTLLAGHGLLCLLDRFRVLDAAGFARRNGPLLNWACASLVVTGVLVQFLLERRRRRKSAPVPVAEPVAEEAPPPPPPKVHRPPEPARSALWSWGQKWLRRAG